MNMWQQIDNILEEALDDVACPKCGGTFHDSRFIAYLENANERVYHCLGCGYNFVKLIPNQVEEQWISCDICHEDIHENDSYIKTTKSGFTEDPNDPDYTQTIYVHSACMRKVTP